MKNKVVAISGAAGGLGPAVARAFLGSGAVLAVSGRNEQKLEQLLDAMGAPSGRRLATAADLTDEPAARGWADAVTKTFGQVDVVVHLVGGYKGGTGISDIPGADWEALHSALVRTTFNVVRAFARPLAAARGRFLAVTSPRAQAPTARSAVYAMAKAASDALVLALASELSGTGATANLIVVDSIATEGEADRKKATPAADIAATMLFLCSEEAASINGARLPLLGRG